MIAALALEQRTMWDVATQLVTRTLVTLVVEGRRALLASFAAKALAYISSNKHLA